MAGRGPAPKPAAQRRRRNTRPDDRTLHAGPPPAAPPLPAKYRGPAIVNGEPGVGEFRYLAATRRWYEAWCASPMASEWTLVHYLRLQEIAILKDRFERTGSIDLAKELRLQMAGFGGTPADLRRLGVSIAPAAEPEAERPSARRRRPNLFAVASGPPP